MNRDSYDSEEKKVDLLFTHSPSLPPLGERAYVNARTVLCLSLHESCVLILAPPPSPFP